MRIVKNGNKAMETAVEAFRKNGGVLRTSQAIRLGIHPRTLYQMRDANRIAQISRGVYRLADLPEVTNPDLVAVATRVPEAIICLVSALAFHEITTEVPHEVYIALPPGINKPRIDYPPLRDFRFSKETLSVGVEKQRVDSVTVKVFDPEKTVADCFKFRNKIGLDVALEALKLCRARRGFQLSKLIRYAKICRVERVMRPYLEALS
jgi:predicted transcriptional regulator of viral defense system